MGMPTKTIAIDFDGVIHQYSKGWQDGSVYDKPVPGVFTSIQQLFECGYRVFIFSTRKPKQIKRWLDEWIMISDYEHSGPGNDPYEWVAPRYGYTCKVIPFWKKFWNKEKCIGITRRKLPAHVYIDDRAVKFDGDWDNTISDVITFETYAEELKRKANDKTKS